MPDQTLDAKGLNCPLPILKTKKALNTMAANETLEVFSTDPGSMPDFEAFCQNSGNTLIESGEDDAVYRFLIRKKSS